MRVALVAESFLPRVNGVSNSVIRVARELTSLGHQVTIVAADSYKSEYFENIPIARMKSVEIPGVHETDVSFASQESLQAELSAFRPDVVHLASPFVLGYRALRAARALGLPTVAIFQTDVAGFAQHYGLGILTNFADAVIRRIHQSVDLTLVPSTASHEYLAQLGVDNVAIWRRGVDTTMFNPSWREQLPSGDKVRVGYLGRLAPEKNVSHLAALLADPTIEVVIIGDGPDRQALESKMPSANFLGHLQGDDLSRAVANLDVVVAPGERETFCQVIQEAMAAGVPVVAPNVGGPRDLVTHGVNGLLYSPADIPGMVSAVNQLVSNRDLRHQMQQAARKTVEARTWRAITEELVGHYGFATSLSAQPAANRSA